MPKSAEKQGKKEAVNKGEVQEKKVKQETKNIKANDNVEKNNVAKKKQEGVNNAKVAIKKTKDSKVKTENKNYSKSEKDKETSHTIKAKVSKTKANKANDKNKISEKNKKESVKEAKATKDSKEIVKDKVEKDKKGENDTEAQEKEHIKLIKFEEIKNIFKKKKTIPKENLKTIRKPAIYNALLGLAVIVYFGFLILGFYNIDRNVYQTDLKVFALSILFVAIIVLEKAYKEDSGRIAIMGIELIIVATISLGLIFAHLMFSASYVLIVSIIVAVFFVYYIIKSMIMYFRERKKYFVNDMKEMINTEE